MHTWVHTRICLIIKIDIHTLIDGYTIYCNNPSFHNWSGEYYFVLEKMVKLSSTMCIMQ